MRTVLLLLICLLCLMSCTTSAPPLPQKSLKPYRQSMTYLHAHNMPWSYAGMPLEQRSHQNNRYAPTLNVKAGVREIVSGGTLNLQVASWQDLDGDQISFWWKSSHGQFVFWNESVTYVRWQAPRVSQDTRVPIHVYASDGRGLMNEKIVWVMVKKLTAHADIITQNLMYYPIVPPRAGKAPVFYPGEDIRVEWMTTNASSHTARYLSMCIWLTPKMTIPATPAAEFLNIGVLDAGAQKQRATNFYIPKNTQPGYYYLAFHSDCEHSITEHNEENNKTFLYIRIRPQGSPRR